MNTKLIKSCVATLAMGALSLSASAGFALPASAHAADVVAPTEPVAGICGQSGTLVATLQPGNILTGSAVFGSGRGSATIADTNGTYSQTFNSDGTINPQSFTIANTGSGIDSVYACKDDPGIFVFINAQAQFQAQLQLQQQQQLQKNDQDQKVEIPIHINVNTNINSNNSRHNHHRHY
ncbi:hypothetical protein [Dictyobacter kobayashii]|uniref:Secreted protein n=1 Tax=Dictyobacter kobayashii TaxID=2014872 RepID=A0A402AKE7_9CHLR|nr:hypothetical protein [Dictyobacter kobayashii]GCE19708.1 hypothetical protein KDK_35080 [Dictyobacter kobayashii]